ncbi:putative permease [Clostridiales bacterium oral taxon 876 str. F0540]|nr:putative permease [Clostridiales bacterium oral taxon 876 str. F0540]
MINIIKEILLSIWHYLRADWLILLIGITLAVAMSVYVDSNKLKNMLMKRTGVSIPGAVIFGSLTPLCACGTMAVLLSMFVSAMPWGPVMAFLISSPLTSPSEYMFETAFFGSKFATAILISSILIGLAAGFLANLLEKKTNFFKDQFRLISEKNESCCSSTKKAVINKSNSLKIKRAVISKEACCTTQVEKNTDKGFVKRYRLDKLAREFINVGIKKILFYFIIFIAIGRIVELIIPQSLIMTLFSADKAYSIPLAATIGLPLYLNDSSALPLLKSLINSGAGQGVVLAFIITGKATGVPVIAGMSTFLKKRAMLFYIVSVYMGGILAGYIFQIIL